MVAELAKGDFEDLRAEGLSPTLEDFDRLNQLALRLECGAETTAANHPRVGWAGDVPFYEPTAAAIMWLEDFARRIPSDEDTQRSFFFFALAHGREPQVFARLETPAAIGAAVKDWLRRIPCTVPEMARACHYAAYGFDDAEAAITPMKREWLRRRNVTASAANMQKLERIMAAAAASSGLGYFELLANTPSRLNAMVVAAQVEAGLQVSRDMAKAQVEYSETVREIRERLKGERNNGK